MGKKSMTASVIKTIAILNGVVGVIVGLVVSVFGSVYSYGTYGSYGIVGFCVIFLAFFIVSIFIYGFGKIIELLNSINNGINSTSNIDIIELKEEAKK
ncbi:MAG: hypothetical protein JJE03_00030 [Peptostreptococcaceae bacterium]|nr:hypothetical protein [Peptostreptococcaceae bacterium]